MDKGQEFEWAEAQKIAISEDLVAAAKQQLEFLAAVDRQRFLYEGPLLERAIHRYENFWLPLLAKHGESGVVDGSLVVPLDCEWIWHCHRLNPVQYKKDCEKIYGRILDNENVKSSLFAKSKLRSTEIWAELYPGEPFELDYSWSYSDAGLYSGEENSITYDLVSAVKRQSVFYYQVARPSMSDSRFLEEAVARYKGFLHLIKKNQETSTNRFCVPTYDIDLIWHSHQLQPSSYCKDMLELLGKILEHDDTDADRTKGKKLDNGFCETTKQWEDTFGLRYWRAGAMYRGCAPSSLDVTPYFSGPDMKNEDVMEKSEILLPLQKTMVVEVLLEIVGVKNLPAEQNGNLFVSFSKKSPDIFLNGSSTLSILSESGEKQVAGFQCEPTGELILALKTNSNSHIKTMGTTSIPLEDLMAPNSKLSVEKWFELKPHTGNLNGKPVSLYVAASFTVPFPAPQEFRMFKPSPISMNTCFFPLKAQLDRRWVRLADDNGNDIISLQMRRVRQKNGVNNGMISKSNIVGVTRLSKKPHVLAEYAENKWSLNDYNLSLHIEKENSQGAHIFELSGSNRIKLFPGKKLECEPKNCHHIELNFITAVEFSADHPYGRAIALLDIESSLIKVDEDQFVLPAILLLFILKKEGLTGKNIKQMANQESKTCDQTSEASAMNASTTQVNSGGCGGGCSVCGNTLNTNSSGGCGGGGCSGGCGDTTTIAGSGPCKEASINYGSGACYSTGLPGF
ncbi:glycine-rich domain-containing protein 1 [Asparagus officinalis]|uniref:glycine-rich domain-containing protein 1 n=1 Tax=Asparagus officinalis TaxID=4686 RepID=UPI00098E7150|nr:glycine-rich domain-containing protein 1 [Asparagus officinalis]